MIYKRLLSTITLIMGVVLSTSCGYDEPSLPDSPQGRIIATVKTPPATRTAMGEAEEGANAVGILWTADDKIGVFEASSSSQRCYTKTGDSGNKADAIFAANAGDAFAEPVHAYYPYNAENDGRSVSSLVGTVPYEQNMDSGNLFGDYKYGHPVGSSEQGHKFVFSHLFSMARIEIDASNTPLAGQKLQKLTITVNRGSEVVNVAGDFTFSAVDGNWDPAEDLHNSITLTWTDGPELSAEAFTCYASLFPTINSGDVFTIEVTAGNYRAIFTATSRIRFEREHIYTFPVTLSKYESLKMYDPNGKEIDYESLLPVINSFSFSMSSNAGKLLDNKLVWSSSKHTPSFESVSSLSASINDDTQEISLTIPYLYDFKLKPSFSTNSNCVVTVNGVQQTSGVSEVDFSNPVTYTVTNTQSKYTRDYKVTISNTGLPVVVIEQSSDGDFSAVKKGGFLGFGAKTLNKFVDFMIRGKDTEWVNTDKLSVYNPDGTPNIDQALCGVRLRGNTTQEYPKKPFAIKFDQKQSVLGMPKHKRWVLLANWLDHSMIRNAVAFDIAHAIEYAVENHNLPTGIPWNVHGYSVELIVDGHHVGNYYLCEQIKIDGNRLDIRDSYEDVIEDVPAPALGDCGYLLECDMKEDEDTKYTTSNDLWVKFKDDEIAGTTLFDEVSDRIQTIEDYLDAGNYTEAYKLLDINSVVDQFLIWELTMNREYGDPGSVYMFMDGDSKLCAGPVWDFDRGTFQNQEKATDLGNSTSYRVKPDNAWMFLRSQESEKYSYIWYRQLAEDETFRQAVQQRWAVIKPYLDMVVSMISEYGTTQAVSYKYNSEMWPTNYSDVREYKSDFKDWSGDEELGANGNYQEVIDNFVSVYQERLAGMDALITSGSFE